MKVKLLQGGGLSPLSTGDDQTPESEGGVIREWYNVTPSLNDMKARDQFVAYNGCRQLCLQMIVERLTIIYIFAYKTTLP